MSRTLPCLALLLAAAPSVALAVPAQLTTQGRVLDADGQPLADTADVTFRPDLLTPLRKRTRARDRGRACEALLILFFPLPPQKRHRAHTRHQEGGILAKALPYQIPPPRPLLHW